MPGEGILVSSVLSCLALYNVRIVLSKREFMFNRYTIVFHDDVDLSLDMWSHGYTSAAVPTVVGVHYQSSTRKRMSRVFSEYENRRGAILLYKRLSKLVKARSLLTPYIRELLYITPRLAIYDSERVLVVTRAFLDALAMKVEPFKGPYEPLLVKLPV